MDAANRNAAVQAFQSEEGPDIMMLSDVGAQGLNLQRGSVMVYVVSACVISAGVY
jgi:hypothetical protein